MFGFESCVIPNITPSLRKATENNLEIHFPEWTRLLVSGFYSSRNSVFQAVFKVGLLAYVAKPRVYQWAIELDIRNDAEVEDSFFSHSHDRILSVMPIFISMNDCIVQAGSSIDRISNANNHCALTIRSGIFKLFQCFSVNSSLHS